jgi:non-canonical purine NTP pyrophosphatase (RdgB/HAM1 family)
MPVMALTFITGNARKAEEAEAILGMLVLQRKVDLPEVQSLDPHEVMRAKLEAARTLGIVPCIVEDSSLTFESLGNKLPGTFIKWFEEALGIDALAALAMRAEDARATSSTIVGYLDEAGNMAFFDGSIEGTMVTPRGDKDFGYGPAFLPNGSDRTFGEMEREEKHAISSRAIAFKKLRSHISTADIA